MSGMTDEWKCCCPIHAEPAGSCPDCPDHGDDDVVAYAQAQRIGQ